MGDRARVLGGGGVAGSGASFPNQPAVAGYAARTAGSAAPGEQHLEGEPQRTTAANNNPQQGKITHGGGRASNPYDGNTVEGGGRAERAGAGAGAGTGAGTGR